MSETADLRIVSNGLGVFVRMADRLARGIDDLSFPPIV